jgi:hypothetical protein
VIRNERALGARGIPVGEAARPVAPAERIRIAQEHAVRGVVQLEHAVPVVDRLLVELAVRVLARPADEHRRHDRGLQERARFGATICTEGAVVQL